MEEAEKGSKFLAKRSNSGGSPGPSTMRGTVPGPLYGGQSQHSPQNSMILAYTQGGISTDRPNKKFINNYPQQSMTPSVARMSKSVVGANYPMSETSTII